MQSLGMSGSALVTTSKTPLVTRNTVLVCFDTARFSMTVAAQLNEFMGQVENAALSFPPKRQIRRGNDLDKVHEVVGLFVGFLLRVVERVQMMIAPGHTLVAILLDHRVW